MSEENTRQLSGSRSFEERVFARFDAIDQRLEKLESRSYDTKPIWERALKAIMDTALEVGEVKKKVDLIETKFDTLETRFDTLETRFDALETRSDTLETKFDTLDKKFDTLDKKVDTIEKRLGNVEGDLAALRVDYAGLHDELIESQRDFKVKITRRIDLVLETLVDTRGEMRNPDERLTRLESKLA